MLARLGPNATDLLERRMEALSLDPIAVSIAAPRTFRDLQRVCSFCETAGRCLRDLGRDPSASAWKDYCPNAKTLTALQAEGPVESQTGERHDRETSACTEGSESVEHEPDATVFAAVAKMAEKDMGSLVVMDGEKMVGIITERHYSRNVVVKGKASPTTICDAIGFVGY
jgi:hypothetical protein